LKLGILGLPGSGKSTLFDLLTESVEGPDFKQARNQPRLKVVKVRDPRLERLRDDYRPRQYTPAAFELLDFPAVSSEETRSGLADLLAPARETDALFVVLRGFEGPGQRSLDVERDFAEVREELILADLAVIEKRLERLAEKSRKRPPGEEDRKECGLLEALAKRLEREELIATFELTPEEKKRLSGFGFLSAKPLVLVVNVGEGPPPPSIESLRSRAECDLVVLNAQNELEILALDGAEQKAFLEEFGITELSRERLISLGYRAAGLISFFTAGEKEVRAWTIRKGETAVQAAGEIHSDIARGFIRAEVVSYDDYIEFGGVKGAREKGHLRLEGKEYGVVDGDIVEFRFSV
jgi:GTP-binding protein YchF